VSTNDNPPSVPWWRWPNVLALDVPVIAVTWQHLLAKPQSPGMVVSAALFGAVWTIYLADRWFDAKRFQKLPGVPMPLRHAFFQFHPRFLLVLLGVVTVITSFLVAGFLSPAIWLGGGILALLVAGYFAWNQLAGDRWGRRWAKELLIGTLFAAGCGWTAILNDLSALPATLALAWVAFLNCALIADLDREADLAAGIQSLAAVPMLRPGRLVLLTAVSALALLAVFVLTGLGRGVGATVAVAVLLAGLPFFRRAFGTEAAAAWADFALFLPAAVALML
jgi:hypothetical protein